MQEAGQSGQLLATEKQCIVTELVAEYPKDWLNAIKTYEHRNICTGQVLKYTQNIGTKEWVREGIFILEILIVIGLLGAVIKAVYRGVKSGRSIEA